MKLCSKDCIPICDFCLNFKPFDNYHDDGICKATGLLEDRSGGYECKDFICFRTNKIILLRKNCNLLWWKVKKKFKKFYRQYKHKWNIKNYIKRKRSKTKAKNNLEELINNQQDLKPEYRKYVDENFFNLLDE